MNINASKQLITDIFLSYLKNAKINTQVTIAEEEYDLLNYHKVDIISFDILNERCFSPNIYDKLLIQKMGKQIFNLEYYLIMSNITRAFKRNNISFVVLKGLPLSVNYYKHISHRSFFDIDLLINPLDIKIVEKVLLEMGYVYGKFFFDDNGDRYPVYADRKQITFQKLYTHELYSMIKTYENEVKSVVDVNFKFTWVGFEEKHALDVEFNDIESNILFNDFYQMPYLREELNLLHMICHFFNEAVYFTFNTNKRKDKDPRELLLFRLLDICLVLNRCNTEKLFQLLKKYCVNDQMEFVLSIIKNFVGLEKQHISCLEALYSQFNVFTLDEINYYFDTDGKKVFWPISLESRLLDIKLKKEVCPKIF